jgi:hypothetical protein
MSGTSQYLPLAVPEILRRRIYARRLLSRYAGSRPSPLAMPFLTDLTK